MDEQAWREKSVEILTDVKEWRRAHPKAAYVEIEEEVHRRMMELEAQVLQDVAQTSASREWGRTSGKQAPLCPKCAVPLQARGKQKRTLQGNGGQRVWNCPKWGGSEKRNLIQVRTGGYHGQTSTDLHQRKQATSSPFV
jgi:hypothetical protein